MVHKGRVNNCYYVTSFLARVYIRAEDEWNNEGVVKRETFKLVMHLIYLPSLLFNCLAMIKFLYYMPRE